MLGRVMVDLRLIIFLLLRMQGKNSIDQKRLMPIVNSVKLKYPYEILRPCCTFHLDLLVLVKGKKTRKVLLSPVQNKSIRGTEI